MLRKNKRFKVGYGVYIMFEINYNKIEIISKFHFPKYWISIKQLISYFQIISFINKNEMESLAQVNKQFYYISKNYFLLYQKFSFNNYLEKNIEKETILSVIQTN